MKPLRHLSGTEIAAAMPSIPERLALAERTLLALGHDAELPPKIGVHPRQTGSLAHAMPALLRGAATDGSADLIGAKWITGFPANPGLGLPTYHALVLLNDALTGEPIAVMDGGSITLQRTAAVSGVAIRHFAGGGGSAAVALLGAGAQARSHLPIIGHLLPGSEVRITDIDSRRAATLAAEATQVEGIASAVAVGSAREAIESARIVISVVSFGPDHQSLDLDWLGPDALFVAVDYDMQAPASLAREALFVVDEREQFLATRSGAVFANYPDPDAALGERLRGEAGGHSDGGGADDAHSGRILVTHLGVGLADVVFASAILARAEQLGLGRLLPR
jgi:ornithine cyclodeaminase/alanine dehydrogenase-like protein (mu-crystallin family)